MAIWRWVLYNGRALTPGALQGQSHAAITDTSIAHRRSEIAALAQPLSLAAFDRSVHISLKYGYVYFETPKVACSTIKLTLFRAELQDEHFSYAENRQIHIAELAPLLSPMNVPDFQKRLGQLFTFCFVRDPATRLVSAYLDKIVRSKPQSAAIVKALDRTDTVETPVSFDEFVGALCDQDPKILDRHWGVQFHQVFSQTVSHDFIGRFENFECDFSKVLQLATIDPRYLRSAREHETRAATLASELLTPVLRAKICNMFKLDYDAFGY